MSEEPAHFSALSHDVRSSWQRFLDQIESLRPELYRYCRHLTHTPWDAEDLAQDTLTKAFMTLGTVFKDVPNPRAWLFRVASNTWIDRVRRARFLRARHHPPDDDERHAADGEKHPVISRHVSRNVANVVQPEQVMIDDAFDEIEQAPTQDHLAREHAQRRRSRAEPALVPQLEHADDRQRQCRGMK